MALLSYDLDTTEAVTAGALGVPSTYQPDLTLELINLIPPSWTSQIAKQLGGTFFALMGGIATLLAWVRSIIDTFFAQLRLLTASAGGLDIIAQDFFGMDPVLSLPRALIPNASGGYDLESDTAYRARIDAELLHTRGTVPAIIAAVTQVTGAAPTIIEPFNAQTFAVYGDMLYYSPGVVFPSGEVTTTVSNGFGSFTKIYLTSTAGFALGSLVEVVGFVTAGGAAQQILTVAPSSDGNGPFITLPVALTAAPGVGGVARVVGTSTISANSTVTKHYVQTNGQIVANSYVAFLNQVQAAGTQMPIRVTSVGSDVNGQFINISPALSAVPPNGTFVYSLGTPFEDTLTGTLNGVNIGAGLGAPTGLPVLVTTTTLEGSTTRGIRVASVNGIVQGYIISVAGLTPVSSLTVTQNLITALPNSTTIQCLSTAGFRIGDLLLLVGVDGLGNILNQAYATVASIISGTQFTVTVPVVISLPIGNSIVINQNVLGLNGALSAAPGVGVAVTAVAPDSSAALGGGYDAFGDIGSKYTFIVEVNRNPNGALPSQVLAVLQRTRPVGTKGILFMSGQSLTTF